MALVSDKILQHLILRRSLYESLSLRYLIMLNLSQIVRLKLKKILCFCPLTWWAFDHIKSSGGGGGEVQLYLDKEAGAQCWNSADDPKTLADHTYLFRYWVSINSGLALTCTASSVCKWSLFLVTLCWNCHCLASFFSELCWVPGKQEQRALDPVYCGFHIDGCEASAEVKFCAAQGVHAVAGPDGLSGPRRAPVPPPLLGPP